MSGDTYDHSMCPPWCIHMGQTCPTDGCDHAPPVPQATAHPDLPDFGEDYD